VIEIKLILKSLFPLMKMKDLEMKDNIKLKEMIENKITIEMSNNPLQSLQNKIKVIKIMKIISQLQL
jgi:hypothetical protein